MYIYIAIVTLVVPTLWLIRIEWIRKYRNAANGSGSSFLKLESCRMFAKISDEAVQAFVSSNRHLPG